MREGSLVGLVGCRSRGRGGAREKNVGRWGGGNERTGG